MPDDRKVMPDTVNEKALSQALRYVVGAEAAAILPSTAAPKLVVPLCDLRSRWRLSAFYPAFKQRAKLWRLLQRFRALVGFSPMVGSEENQTFHEFLTDVFPCITHTAVLLGTGGPNRKIIVQLWQKDQLVGFLKVAARESATDKIKTEAIILKSLPKGLGPELLKSSELDGHAAMVLSPVEGDMLEASLPEASELGDQLSDIRGYLEQLKVSDKMCKIDEHPAIGCLLEKLSNGNLNTPDTKCQMPNASQFDQWLEPLREQEWATVIQHGDFAPWNVFCQPNGSLCAIDWEEGCVDGFPYFDLIHFITQTAALCSGWSPEQTFRYLYDLLGDELADSTISIIRLGLLNSFVGLHESLDGPHWIQDWRRRMWEMEV